MASRVGVAIAPQSFDQRCTLATTTLLQQVLAARMHHHAVEEPWAGRYLADHEPGPYVV